MDALYAIVGGYIVVSVTLLFFPELVHRRKKTSISPVHISHRGGAGENIENSMAAFRHAVATGTDMLELDVHLTLDRQVVVVHDANLLRLCGVDVAVAALDYAKLPPLLSSLQVSFSPNMPPATSAKPLLIPLLGDVFAAFPDMAINLDVKASTPGLVELVAALIEKHDRVARTIVGSGKHATSLQLAQRLPSSPRFVSAWGAIRMLLLFYAGLLPFVPISESFLEIPLPRQALGQLAASNRRWHVRALHAVLVNRFFFRHLQRRGIKILLWVLNDEASIRDAFAIGADGVMSDYPTLLSKVCAST